jgi:glutathione S-transferase
MELLLGNTNYSSWSMRAGVVAHAFEIPVETTMIWLDEPDAAQKKREKSPAGRVPILADGDVTIWDSLAICEYWAEVFADRHLWPAEPRDRARARSLCAEMHAGFPAIREQLPMNIRAQKEPRPWPGAVVAEVARIAEIFAGARGPYLFDGFTVADAFFAPVVCRFETYQVDIPDEAGHYCATLLNHPSVRHWIEMAESEDRHISRYD